MEKNKYYTPDVEEFHVGLEFETKWRFEEVFEEPKPEVRVVEDDEWTSQIFDQYWSVAPVDLHSRMLFDYNHWVRDKKLCRVKYLDKEDIESLGWKEINSSDYLEVFSFGNYDEYVMFRINPNELSMFRILLNGNTIFKGTIKNKSELKRVLKQVGVYDKTNTKEV